MGSMKMADTLRRITTLWEAAFHKFEQRWGPKLKSYFPLELDIPDISWSLFIGERLTDDDVALIEANFKRDRPSISKPYLMLPHLDGYSEPTFLDARFIRDGRTAYCFTDGIIRARARPKYSVEVGPFDDDLTFEAYAAFKMKVLGTKDRSVPEINKRINQATRAENRIILVRSDGEIIGTSCVSVFGGVGWLYGGTVDENFRRQGVWAKMLSIRQEISSNLGARSWFLQTEHRHLAAKFDDVLMVDTFRHQ